jgi:hypothetical protein
MEEKELTDEEIINALEHCTVNYPSCEGCPLYNEQNCATKAIENTIALIQRLQENNANQVRMRCDMQRKFDDLQTLCTEQREEIEELKKDYIELDLECRELRTELDKELDEHEKFTEMSSTEIKLLTTENLELKEKLNNLLSECDKCFIKHKKENTKI